MKNIAYLLVLLYAVTNVPLVGFVMFFSGQNMAAGGKPGSLNECWAMMFALEEVWGK